MIGKTYGLHVSDTVYLLFNNYVHTHLCKSLDIGANLTGMYVCYDLENYVNWTIVVFQ